MKKSKTKDLFVIFALPQQHRRPGTVYYGNDGTITDKKSKAAKFYTFPEAEHFAKQKNIELTASTYIGLETFSEYELSLP